jgi:hypothetical protein
MRAAAEPETEIGPGFTDALATAPCWHQMIKARSSDAERYRHVAAIIFTERTVNVACSCCDEPMADLRASLLFNFVSLVMPMTSTVWPTCAVRRPPMKAYDGLFSKESPFRSLSSLLSRRLAG